MREAVRDSTRKRPPRCATRPSAAARTAMVGHEFRHTPQRAYIKQLLDEGYIGTFPDVHDRALPRPLRHAASRGRSRGWRYESEGGGLLGALGSHYIDGLRHWFGDVTTVTGRLANLRPDLVNPATKAIVQAETDDTFWFTLEFENGGMATMIASFAATPDARREDRRDGRSRHARRRAAGAQSDGRRRRRREPRRRAAEAARRRRRSTRRSPTRAITG